MFIGPMFIGIDLDNTLIDYDRLFAGLAVEQGMLDQDDAVSKLAVRDLLRSRPGGEEQWRALQRLAYGPRILEAGIAPGACAFLARLAELGGRAVIVSHKSRTPKHLPEPDFHAAAREFLAANQLLAPHTPIEQAHFQATRTGKAALVAELGCTHFIDDLVEVFEEAAFPAGVLRILYRNTTGVLIGRGVQSGTGVKLGAGVEIGGDVLIGGGVRIGSSGSEGPPGSDGSAGSDGLSGLVASPDQPAPRNQAAPLGQSAPPGQAESHNQRAPNQDNSPDQADPHVRPWDLAGDWAFISAHLFGGPGEGA